MLQDLLTCHDTAQHWLPAPVLLPSARRWGQPLLRGCPPTASLLLPESCNKSPLESQCRPLCFHLPSPSLLPPISKPLSLGCGLLPQLCLWDICWLGRCITAVDHSPQRVLKSASHSASSLLTVGTMASHKQTALDCVNKHTAHFSQTLFHTFCTTWVQHTLFHLLFWPCQHSHMEVRGNEEISRAWTGLLPPADSAPVPSS